jgi:hypothetical protein
VSGFTSRAAPTSGSRTPRILVASGGTGALSGLTGTQINAKTDLGLTDKRLPKLQLTLRPVRSQKFRLEYIPIDFPGDGDADAQHRLQRPALSRRHPDQHRRSTGRRTASHTSSTS